MLSLKNIVTVAALVSLTHVAQATIDLNFVYDPGTNTTTASYSGTWDVDSAFDLDLEASRLLTAESFASFDGSSLGVFFSLDSSPVLTEPFPFAVIETVNATSSTGDPFGFTGASAFGPAGFTASTSISGSLIFSGSNLADLGLTPGSSGTIAGISVGSVNWTASVATTAVPEPSTYAFILGLLGAGAAVVLRRRNGRRS